MEFTILINWTNLFRILGRKFQYFIRTLNNVDPYQSPHSVAPGLGLYVPQKGRHAYMSYYAI